MLRRWRRSGTIVVLASVLFMASSRAEQAVPPTPAIRLEPISAILDAFKSHQLVTLPGGHTDGNALHALIQSLIRDPRFSAVVNDIVVEFGNARYQDLVDRFVRGEDVPEAALRQVWQNTVQAGVALDNPNTAAFFHTVREVNATLPPARRLRVLLDDAPIDWDNVRSKADHRKWEVQRDSYAADLVRREVVERQRRALILAGNGHLMRKEQLTNYDMTDWQAQTIVSLLERDGAKVFVIRQAGTIEKWQPDIASWPAMSITRVRGTVLGAVDFSEYDSVSTRYAIRGVDDFVPLPRDQWRPLRMEEQADALLYVPSSAQSSAPLSPTLCAEPTYIKMRLERMALLGLPPREADTLKRLCRLE